MFSRPEIVFRNPCIGARTEDKAVFVLCVGNGEFLEEEPYFAQFKLVSQLRFMVFLASKGSLLPELARRRRPLPASDRLQWKGVTLSRKGHCRG